MVAAGEIRSLLFDLGNVIIDLDQEGCMHRMRKLLRDDADHERIDQIQVSYECGLVSSDIFINTILRESHRKTQAVDVIEVWNSMLVNIPAHRLEMLREVRKKFNVYLLSNTNAIHLQWVHRYVKLHYGVNDFEKEFFDQAYYSHLVGDRKPMTSIFRHVIDDALLTPGTTLYMDDMEVNIKVAASLGFKTYLVKEDEDVSDYLKTNGFY